MKTLLLAAMFIGCNYSVPANQTGSNPPPKNPNPPTTVSMPEGGSPYSYLLLAAVAMMGAIRLAKRAKKNT